MKEPVLRRPSGTDSGVFPATVAPLPHHAARDLDGVQPHLLQRGGPIDALRDGETPLDGID